MAGPDELNRYSGARFPYCGQRGAFSDPGPGAGDGRPSAGFESVPQGETGASPPPAPAFSRHFPGVPRRFALFMNKPQKCRILPLHPPKGLDKYPSTVGAWPSGKASVFGTVYRRFESYRPSQINHHIVLKRISQRMRDGAGIMRLVCTYCRGRNLSRMTRLPAR